MNLKNWMNNALEPINSDVVIADKKNFKAVINID